MPKLNSKTSDTGTTMKNPEIEIPEEIRDSRGGFEAFKNKISNVGQISIRPFVNKDKSNMGLEKYNFVLFPGAVQEEQITCLEYNGTFRYITGLDEFAPEIQNIKDEAEKKAAIRNIRGLVSFLEERLASNSIDPEDKEFWSKVKKVRPDNSEFWDKVSVRCTNDVRILKPTENADDLIIYMGIEAGGFSTIAKSYEEALSSPKDFKFYLDKKLLTVSNNASYKKLRNKAIAELDNMAKKLPEKMLYLCKLLDINGVAYKRHTISDVLYDFLDDYIQGNTYEKDKSKTAEKFIDYAKMDMETLKLKAMIKDAVLYRIIVTKPDGSMYHGNTGSYLGKNQQDILVYLKNPQNEDVLDYLLQEIDDLWN